MVDGADRLRDAAFADAQQDACGLEEGSLRGGAGEATRAQGGERAQPVRCAEAAQW